MFHGAGQRGQDLWFAPLTPNHTQRQCPCKGAFVVIAVCLQSRLRQKQAATGRAGIELTDHASWAIRKGTEERRPLEINLDAVGLNSNGSAGKVTKSQTNFFRNNQKNKLILLIISKQNWLPILGNLPGRESIVNT